MNLNLAGELAFFAQRVDGAFTKAAQALYIGQTQYPIPWNHWGSVGSNVVV